MSKPTLRKAILVSPIPHECSVVVITGRCQRLNPGSNPGTRTIFQPLDFILVIDSDNSTINNSTENPSGHGLVVMTAGSQPANPGSTPGVRTIFFYCSSEPDYSCYQR